MDVFSSPFTLGILGGGQLGKMLLTETRKWDIRTKVMDPSSEAPCRIACNEFVQGDLLDFETVLRFGRDVDVLTIEIENVNVEALEALEKMDIQVFPSAKTLRTIQNKGVQKTFYEENGIPTSEFVRFKSRSEIEIAYQAGTLNFPFVWKSARFGYDGQGVKVVRNQRDFAVLPDVECLTEQFVDFATELAVIVARNPSGEMVTYPVVEMEFHPEANQVEYVICPARIPSKIAEKAQKTALLVAEKMQHVGLLAVEMFLTKTDAILVNEVAPRPHNSGHYSIEASYTNQFEQHLRAVLDMPLGNTKSKLAGVMVNLVGAEGHTGDVRYQHMEEVLGMSGVTPHLYGKKQTCPFRKMGHVTIVDADMKKARAVAQEVKEKIKVISL